jgi:uncharacterized membrane protein
MSETTRSYSSLIEREDYKSQALRVWAVFAAVAAVWLVSVSSPPLLNLAGMNGMADTVFGLYGYLCHQIPDRSFHVFEHQFAVCSRCYGVYAGVLGGVLVYPAIRTLANIEPLPRRWLFIAIVPMAIDWSLTFVGIWQNTHLSRFVTGFILGAACSFYIVPALVEIARHISGRRQAKG